MEPVRWGVMGCARIAINHLIPAMIQADGAEEVITNLSTFGGCGPRVNHHHALFLGVGRGRERHAAGEDADDSGDLVDVDELVGGLRAGVGTGFAVLVDDLQVLAVDASIGVDLLYS